MAYKNVNLHENCTIPTRYSFLSDKELHSLYLHRNWTGLDENERLDLLQETVNREVIADGGNYFGVVDFENMRPSVAGSQSGFKINLNRDMFVNDVKKEVYNNTTISFDLENSNMLAYETVLHESRHLHQYAATLGLADASPDQLALYKANDFTVTNIDGKRASQYLKGINSYSLYYLNPTELDAYKVSEEKAMTLAKGLEAEYGTDNSLRLYQTQIESDGYQAKLDDIKEYLGENIDNDVAQVLMNYHYGTDVPVRADVKEMVTSEMIATQQEIDSNRCFTDCATVNKTEQETFNDIFNINENDNDNGM